MPDISFIVSKTDLVLSAFLALAFTAAPYYIQTGSCSLTVGFFMTAVFMFAGFLVCSIGMRSVLFGYFSNINNQQQRCVHFEKLRAFLDGKYAVYKIACIIFLFWLPILIALYPGTLQNDTWGQLCQFIRWSEADGSSKGIMNDHHPVFDTFFMGILMVPLAKLTGNWHVSIFVYVIIQACLTSLSFSYSMLYLRKKLCLDEICTTVLLLFYCIVPVYAASVQTVSKDALFSWIYVLFFVLFIEIVSTNGKALNNKKFFYFVILSSVFCALTKKVGLYVIVFSFASLLLAGFNSRRKIVSVMLTVIILMAGVMPLARRAVGIGSGGLQEMFSIPFQQTARYVKLHPQDVTPSEKMLINKVLDYDNLAKKYNPLVADPVKQYHQRGRSIDYVRYIKAWSSQFLRHPETYADAFAAMLSGWFSFTEYDPLMNMDWHSQLDEKLIPGWVPVRPEFSAKTANSVQKAYHNLYHTPVWRMFLTNGFFAAILPAFVLSITVSLYHKKSVKYYLASAPMLLSIVLGCWLAPDSIGYEGRRYLYPLTYTAPLLLAWCMYIYQTELSGRRE